VKVGSVMPAAASSGMSRFVAIAARTASSLRTPTREPRPSRLGVAATRSGSSSMSSCVVMLVSTADPGIVAW
jgi:hypothetical protein